MQSARTQKCQALDCAAESDALMATRQTERANLPAGSEQREPRPLVHSISIVVELAKETQQDERRPKQARLQSGGSFSSHCSQDDGDEAEEDEEENGMTTTTTTMATDTPTTTTTTTTSSTTSDEHQAALDEEVDLPPQVAGDEPGQRNRRKRASRDDEEGDDQDGDEDEEEEEEEEEEDERGCLASSLARRVVLVDEADKKFLRNRAQSAEPQMLRSIFANFYQERAGRSPTPPRCESASPQVPPPTGAGLAMCRKTSEFQLSAAARRPPSPPLPASSPRARHSLAGGSLTLAGRQDARVSVSGSELAERGRLSMRRNTHHQQHYQTPASQAREQRSSESLLAHALRAIGEQHTQQQQQQPQRVAEFPQVPSQQQQLQRVLSSASATLSNASQQQQQTQRGSSPLIAHQRQANWHHLPLQHRRQSLQISLLSGLPAGAARCADSSRSLTEEELRGEREFNEQVRSAARSPADLFAPRLIKSSGTGAGLGAPPTRSTLDEQRCRSTGHDDTHQANRIYHHNMRSQAHSRLTAAEAPSGGGNANPRHQRRRVSFGCIDPIELAPASAAHATGKVLPLGDRFVPRHSIASSSGLGRQGPSTES